MKRCNSCGSVFSCESLCCPFCGSEITEEYIEDNNVSDNELDADGQNGEYNK